MSQTIDTTAIQIGAAPRRALARLASKSLLVTLSLAALGMSGYAGAATVAVTNAGFESPVLGDGAYNGTLEGWTNEGGTGGTFNPTSAHISGEASEGSNTHYSDGSTYSQTLAETLKAGTYTLQVDVGVRSDACCSVFRSYQVKLGVLDGTTFVELAQDDNTLLPATGWLTSTVSADVVDLANIGKPIVIKLVGLPIGRQVNFDNVRLDFDAAPGPVDIYLQTQSFIKDLPDGSTVPMWGFASCTDATFTSCASLADTDAPGPQINAFEGESLTVHVSNTLPTPVSLVVPGQAGGGDPVPFTDGKGRSRTQSFTHETAADSTNTYTWSALRAGTYLYQSGTHPSIQVPMGLYGALVVHPAGNTYCPNNNAYDNANSCYSADTVLLFSEIDPVQNTLVDAAAGDVKAYPKTIDYSPTFLLINGEGSMADPLPAGAAGDTVLLRFLNAGLRTHTPSIVGLEMGLIAEDGNAYPGTVRQQSTLMLPAGKTHDVVATMPDGDVTFALFDRMPTFSNDALPEGGTMARLQVGSGSTPVPPAPGKAVADSCTVPEDAIAYPCASVTSNDDGLSNPVVVSGTSNGALVLNPADGTFTYTPNPDFSGADSFTYSATDGASNYGARVTLNVSFENDAPMAADDAYVNTVGGTLSIAAPGILGNDADADGDTLTAVIDGTPPDGLTLSADGSFTYNGLGETSFDYIVSDGVETSTATVVLTINPASGIALKVQDPDGNPVNDYRWTVEEDNMWQPDPSLPDSVESLATNFHRSYMPVVAQGNGAAEFAEAALDPNKHYYVSVLPADAVDGDSGHTIGGARIMPGFIEGTEVIVNVNKQPLGYAQISIFVFEDNSPTNGAVDGNEPGLGGFEITLEDAGGRYGVSAGTLSQDADGNPLSNSLDCFGGSTPPVGVIRSCPDTQANRDAGLVGQVLIKNLFPGKYGVITTPPLGSPDSWSQTSTIEGTKVIDAWVKSNEPAFFTEFGPAGWHVFVGFVSPERTARVNPGGGNVITGSVTNMHMSRPPVQTLYDSGTYDALLHTRPWVGLNSVGGIGPNFAAVQADINETGDGTYATFSLPGVPDGNYQLVVWDSYLDQVIAYKGVTVSGGGADVGNIPVFQWFARLENNVFLDTKDTNGDTNGVFDDGEAGLPEQAVNLRWRDGSLYQSMPTDAEGFVPFDQMFPFFHWLVAEVDYTRFKPTGLTVTVDHGGDVSTTGYVLNPQTQVEDCTDESCTSRTETGPVLTQGVQGFLGQTSVFDWGKVPYEVGENGGISGIVYYASTRAESDPRLAVGEPWEPGVPRVKVRLYREVAKAPANAVPVAVVNAGFENELLGDGGFNTAVAGWTNEGGTGGTFNPTSAQISGEASEGSNTHYSDGSTYAQTLVETLQAGTYTLQVDVGVRADTCCSVFRDYQVQLGVNLGGTFVGLALDDNSQRPTSGFLPATVTLSVEEGDLNIGQPLEIRLVGLPTGRQVNFDNVLLNYVAPGATSGLALVAETETDSWDDSLPTGCPGADPSDPVTPGDKCYDGLRNFNQARPAVFDGGYAFGADGSLPPGKYVVELVPPAGYDFLKEEDVNVSFGDTYAYAPVAAAVGPAAFAAIVPDAAMVLAATGPEPGLAQPPCVGSVREVPENMSLFPGAAEPAPFALASRPLCDRKLVTLSDQGQAAADFFVFTGAPVSGHFVGMILDDTAQEFNPRSPQFGEKWAPPFVPVSILDHLGQEISRVYSDQWGRMNGLLPSTFTANMPSPSGYAPAMLMTCMNDPGPIPDPNGGTMIDPQYNPAYSTFCYTFQYMPGTTTYLDTPVLPVSAFASGYNPPDCSLDPGTPMIRQVTPLVAPGGTLTLTSMGDMQVPNPAYEGPGTNAKTISRDFGFGDEGILTLDGVPVTGAVSWANNTITWTVPGGFPTGEYQLVVTRDNLSSTQAITVTVSNSGPDAIVLAGGSIQDAIDNADYGDLILVEPGVYNESVIMWKPVRLQGSGAGSTLINGANRPTEKLAEWRATMDIRFGVNNALPNQPVGAAGFDTEEGAAITVFGRDTNNRNQGSFARWPSRIDGFAITGGDVGGGIFVNGYADDLVIANNYVFGNSGSYHGGIRIGRPFLELDTDGPYGFNPDISIHHNAITQNGGLDGAGGGLSIATGTDGYNVSNNFVCGNFSMGDGGGIGHLGLSDGGVIANNRIVLNQNFNQATTVSGGGVFIGGEPGAGGVLTFGAGDVTVDANLIRGNHAAAGHGGGIRTQFVNGQDVVNSLNNGGNMSLGQWYRVTVTNNMVVNNVAGWSGAGVSLQDTARSVIVNNTIANNDSTATVQATFENPNLSANQPAGISSEPHSAGLNAAIYVGGNTGNLRDFSNPTLSNNIVWQNRSFHYDATGGTAILVPDLAQTSIGACEAGAVYSDLGVLGGAFALNPVFSVLTDTTGYAASNTSGDPALVDVYCNGGRTLATTPGSMQAIPALDEGGNAWIDVRFGPLVGMGDYHIGVTSSAFNSGSNSNAPDHDFDSEERPMGARIDRGADELTVPPSTGTVAATSASFGTLSGGTLDFGDRPNSSNTDSTLTLTVAGEAVWFGTATEGSDRFSVQGGTCQGQLVQPGTCTVIVRFSQNNSNTVRTATLTVIHNGVDNPLTLALTGR